MNEKMTIDCSRIRYLDETVDSVLCNAEKFFNRSYFSENRDWDYMNFPYLKATDKANTINGSRTYFGKIVISYDRMLFLLNDQHATSLSRLDLHSKLKDIID